MFRFRYNLYRVFHMIGIPISDGSATALCFVGIHSGKRLGARHAQGLGADIASIVSIRI